MARALMTSRDRATDHRVLEMIGATLSRSSGRGQGEGFFSYPFLSSRRIAHRVRPRRWPTHPPPRLRWGCRVREAGEVLSPCILSRARGSEQGEGLLFSSPLTRASWTLLLLLSLLLLPACSTTVQDHGRQNISAGYSGSTLSANLPASVRVQAAIAAAESALRDRGYAIGQRRSTEDTGFVNATPPNAGWMEKTTVAARVSGPGTRITVEVHPWGDQALSRAILDDILKRLGL